MCVCVCMFHNKLDFVLSVALFYDDLCFHFTLFLLKNKRLNTQFQAQIFLTFNQWQIENFQFKSSQFFLSFFIIIHSDSSFCVFFFLFAWCRQPFYRLRANYRCFLHANWRESDSRLSFCVERSATDRLCVVRGSTCNATCLSTCSAQCICFQMQFQTFCSRSAKKQYQHRQWRQ